MWWVSDQIVGKAKIIPSNDILIYEVSCFTKVHSKVAIVSGMAMETRGLSVFKSLGTHSPVFGWFPQKSSSRLDHCFLSPFNLPSTIQAILLGAFLVTYPQRGQSWFLTGICVLTDSKGVWKPSQTAGRQGNLALRNVLKGTTWNLCSYRILINSVVLLYTLDSSMGFLSGLHLHFSVDQKCTFEASLLMKIHTVEQVSSMWTGFLLKWKLN